MFLGYALAVLAILGSAKVVVALLVLAVPIIDTFWVIVRRLSSRRSPFSPDRGHIHHRLLDLGLSHRSTVLLIYVVCATLGLMSLLVSNATGVLAFLGALVSSASSPSRSHGTGAAPRRDGRAARLAGRKPRAEDKDDDAVHLRCGAPSAIEEGARRWQPRIAEAQRRPCGRTRRRLPAGRGARSVRVHGASHRHIALETPRASCGATRRPSSSVVVLPSSRAAADPGDGGSGPPEADPERAPGDRLRSSPPASPAPRPTLRTDRRPEPRASTPRPTPIPVITGSDAPRRPRRLADADPDAHLAHGRPGRRRSHAEAPRRRLRPRRRPSRRRHPRRHRLWPTFTWDPMTLAVLETVTNIETTASLETSAGRRHLDGGGTRRFRSASYRPTTSPGVYTCALTVTGHRRDRRP